MDGATPTVNSAELIATLFAFIPIPVAVADEGGSIVIANSSFKEIFNCDTAVSFMSQREIEIPGHGIFEVQTLPMNDQGYRIVYATDVSIQARLGKKVELLEKMAAIGRVVGGVAHELHNPLKDIMEYGPMLEQCEMDPKARSIIEAVFASTERAGHLVQNLITFAGNAESPQVPFDLNEIVRNVMAQRCASDSWRQFDVTLDLERNLPRTVGRPSQIEQVITALMLNAEDAIARVPHGNGSILVQTGVRAGRVQVQVADNGQARDSARMFSAGHADVGLNICAEIAKDHGGDLFVWSSYGNGSTFTVELPIYSQQKPETASSVNVAEFLRNKSVLVIDDEIHISELIEDVLSLRGANVRVFNSGTEAYEHLFSNEFDLIICNQSMPGLSGLSLYRLMERANPAMNQRFLFITEGMITAHDRQFFAETGVQYLRKPFRIQDLVDAVEGVLSRSLPRGF